MEPIARSDIFFIITSISVVLITVILVIVGIYLIRIIKNFSHVSEKLKNAVDNADSEIREMTEHVRDSPIFSLVFGKKRLKKPTK